MKAKKILQAQSFALVLKKKKKHWDKKWRLVIFDIPEKSRGERAALRSLLKNYGFQQIQRSVWLSPFDVLNEVEKSLINFSTEVILIETSKISRSNYFKKIFFGK